MESSSVTTSPDRTPRAWKATYAKRYFLTFPQCDVDRKDLQAHLLQFGTYNQYIIAKEQHEDGNKHMHCLIEYVNKVKATNARYFDYEGHHCHVKTVGRTNEDWNRCWHYCLKEDEKPVYQGKINID